MKAIGGYFGLELPKPGAFPHMDGLLVNSARNALEAILRGLPAGTEVLLPRFTCEVVFEPFVRTGIGFSLYDVDDNLELTELPYLKGNQYLLYTNYFGIKTQYVNRLSAIYNTRLIIDNAQAFFDVPENGSHAVYSPRKFVGVADGGIAMSSSPLKLDLGPDTSYGRFSHLLKRLDMGAEAGYADFSANDASLVGLPTRRMPELTKAILESIDWNSVKDIRRENFSMLHNALGRYNQLEIPSSETYVCPMVYPYRTDNAMLRQHLISNKVFVATYWPNVLRDNPEQSTAHKLSASILPLPIDQRYGEEEMDYIVELIVNNL